MKRLVGGDEALKANADIIKSWLSSCESAQYYLDKEAKENAEYWLNKESEEEEEIEVF